MPHSILEWTTNEQLAVGKGATVQEFVATLAGIRFEIDIAPWGEGHLGVDGREVAHISNAGDRRKAFRNLKEIADRLLGDIQYKQQR
jgi:enoyl-[acyl-carrier protein] reductase I